MRSFAVLAALGVALAATPSFAQSPQPQPATPSSVAAAGGKFAFVNIQRVASESSEGKASTTRVQALNQQKVTQLNDMNKKLQADQQKLQSQSGVLNDATRAQLERDIDRQQKEIQRFTQDAQEEVQQLQGDLQNTFQQKLLPVIQQVVQERGLSILFSQADAGIVWADPTLDLTAEVIKRFDANAPATAAPSTTTTPAAPGTTPPAGAGTTTPPARPAPTTPVKPPAPKPPVQ
jgi:outer membrane protein